MFSTMNMMLFTHINKYISTVVQLSKPMVVGLYISTLATIKNGRLTWQPFLFWFLSSSILVFLGTYYAAISKRLLFLLLKLYTAEVAR